MKKFTKIALLMLIVLPCFLLSSGCGGGGSSAPPILLAITIAPTNGTFVAGTSFHYIATGFYSSGLLVDVTQSVTWNSSDPTVATISNASGSRGLATTVAAGTTTITGTVNGISASTQLTVTPTGANVMEITVNGDLCSAATTSSYFNKPCVQVTVCNPNSGACQTVSDLLLDTGSTGLRVFRSAISSVDSQTQPLTQLTTGGGSLAGCVQFADGSSLWGPIKMASVQLGNEPAVLVPIQVMDSTFPAPSGCSNADQTPSAAGFNGILGVDVFARDCGPACATNPNIGSYYSCTGASCVGTTVPTASQVANPVAILPVDNNGIQVQLPPVGINGTTSLTGSLILGIGTQANNTPGTVTVLPEDSAGDFRTLYPNSGTSNNSFVDTGSNALFIPNLQPTVLPPCAFPNQAWYCPPLTRAVFATATGVSGSPAVSLSFNVGNFVQLVSTGNQVFSDVAGPSTFGFDWGLPFFMGRNVYLGYDQQPVPGLGTGPFVAF